MKKNHLLRRKQTEHDAERHLWGAVVEKAKEDALSESRMKGTARNRASALQFLFDGDRRMYSFLWCCEQLDLEPWGIRRLVRETLKERARVRKERGYREICSFNHVPHSAEGAHSRICVLSC